VNNIIRKV